LTALLQRLLDLAAAHPSTVGLIVLLATASEAIVIIGAIFPGTSIVLALAGIAGATHGNIWLLTLWAIAGAIIGDGLSFWIGHRYGSQLRQMWPFRQRPRYLDQGAAFFERYGGKSVFFARFLPGVRAFVPVTAGMLGMTIARFYVANVTSAVAWAISHVLLAASVGVALVTLGNMSGRLATLAGGALLIILIVFWLARLTIRRLAPAAAIAYEGAVARLARRPDMLSRRLARILDPTHPRIAAIALWSGVLVIASIGFLNVLEDIVSGDLLVRTDTAINHLAQSLRTPSGDITMTVITSLGDTVVIWWLAVFVVAWLCLRRAFAVAGAVALTMGISTAFVFAMKTVLHKSRPIEIYSGASAFSFPSGHTTLTTVLCGVIAVLVSKSLPRSAQIGVFTVTGIVAGAIGLSRIYLSAHWTSDVLGGFLFGIGMTSIFALIFEHLSAERIGRAGLTAVAVTAFAILGTSHASSSLQGNLTHYAKQPAGVSLAFEAWRTKAWRTLPTHRTDLIGEPEEPLIVQWAGDKTRLAARLAKAGWLDARPWAAKDALQIINPAATLKALPPLPLLNDGLPPVLTMIQAIPSAKERRLVFRAWPSQSRVIKDGSRAPILVGSITSEKFMHPFGFISTLRDSAAPNSASAKFESELRADPLISAIVPESGTQRASPILAFPVGSLL